MKNILFIEGGSITEIRKALTQWIQLYERDINEVISFELYKNGRGSHIIKADDNLGNEQFNYLLNYLKYPEDINYKIDITGYTTITSPTVFPDDRIGEEILIFIPANDKEYDNVYWVTKGNQVYKTDFGGKTVESDIAAIYKEPVFDSLQSGTPEIIYTATQKNKNQSLEHLPAQENTGNIGKRFKIISIIFGCLLLAGLLTYKDNPTTFGYLTMIIGGGAWTWFMVDYKMLRVTKYYNLSFVAAIVILGYGYLMKNSVAVYKSVGELNWFFSLPLLFLVVQKPLRLAFVSVVKKEPVIEKPMPSIADFVYFIILVAAVFLLAQLIPRTVI